MLSLVQKKKKLNGHHIRSIAQLYRVHFPIADTCFISRAHLSTGHIIGSYYYLWVDIGLVYDPY